jgi:hypothetical protein
MLVIGNLDKDVVWEHSIIQMEVNTKENGKIIINMARVSLHLKMDHSI